MSGGYAPVFDSVFRGTLCGKWPDLPVWLTLLPLMDAHGEIDMTHEAISRITGWPIDLLRQAITSLEQPDPRSRSGADDGRRLIRIDEFRDWGWKVVNAAMYRRKASDINQSRRQVDDGRAADKQRRYRERQQGQSLPAVTGSDHSLPALTDTHTHTHKEINLGQKPSGFDRFWAAYPRKVKKKPAMDLWRRKQLDPKTDLICSDIAARLDRDADWKRGYIPHPTTYLQQERWNDELQTSQKSDGYKLAI